jgi:Fe-S-cluster containining protein
VDTETRDAAHALGRLFSQVTTAQLEPHFSREGIKAALVQIMALAQDIVKNIDDAQTCAGVECGPGCSYCCYTQVKLTPAEALLAFSWIAQEFSDQDQTLLWQRVDNNRRLTEGQSLSTRVRIKESVPCIFLKEKACSIYPVRPFICRSWSSYSRRACMDAFHTGNHTSEIETSTSSNFVFSLARQSIQTVCHSHGLESKPLELPRAMDCCHAISTPFNLWLQGGQVFEGIVPCP